MGGAKSRALVRASPIATPNIVLYQTLVGAWPISKERVWTYMNKAVREAKLQTSWTNPDQDYEDNLQAFVDNILGDRNFVADLEGFVTLFDALWMD